MQCPVCAEEKFDTLLTQRNRNADGKFTTSIDRRQIVCRSCKTVFVTETHIAGFYKYNEQLCRSRLVRVEDK